MATLASLADMLAPLDDDLPVVLGGDIYTYYAGGMVSGSLLVPSHFTSYRGYYDRPALVPEYARQAVMPTVGWLEATTRATVGETFAGWKGGDYVMQADSALYVAQEGDATQIGIFDVVVADGRAVVVTYDVSDY